MNSQALPRVFVDHHHQLDRSTVIGTVNHSFMTIMDVLPTFLEIAGTEHPGAGPYKDGREVRAIEGRSFWPHLTGAAPTAHSLDDTAGWSAGGGRGALIRGDYKLINDRMPRGSMGVTIWRLYNMAEDPGETRDLAALFSRLTAELVEEWEENWR